ncbi:MAG: cupin domain-containing protein [Deltaproteobacteria bacterium]|nr:MAG: cupin domain-containing protein [Deltaproteobacteria bacterium]
MKKESTENLKEVSLIEGVKARFFSGEKIMFSLVRLDPNVVLPAHSHPHEQMGFVLEGSLVLRSGEKEEALSPGDVYALKGDEPHEAVAGPDGALVLDVFSPVREEYLKMVDEEGK